MSEPLAPSGTVHWIGTGMSTGSGLRLLATSAHRVVLWGRTAAKAQLCLDRVGVSCDTAAYDLATLTSSLAPGDIVVSMLPAPEHPQLLQACISRRAHFACSSYVSEGIEALATAAQEAGVVVLTEAGLDPGIDHLLADLLVDKARSVIGSAPATADFTSYCGGIPAVPNEFRYRFSWAPRGVLNALRSPARYIDGGQERVAERPWEATKPHTLAGEQFEIYPNRDSLPFIGQYSIPDSWRLNTFVRGTIRLDGWSQAWGDVFTELRQGTDSSIGSLADELAARYPTTDADRDRVVLTVALHVRADNGVTWSGEYLLDAIGDDQETAMARCVSTPLAFGVTEILNGHLASGLRRAADGATDAPRWLKYLDSHGIHCRYSEIPTTTEEAKA